jgi:hypothetical protein
MRIGTDGKKNTSTQMDLTRRGREAEEIDKQKKTGAETLKSMDLSRNTIEDCK